MNRDRNGARLTPRALEMKRLIEEQERSGSSIQAFAEGRGLRAETLYWWRGELRRREESRRPDATPGLIPVRVMSEPEAAPSRSAFWVELMDGRRSIAVPPDFDAAALRRLLEVMSSC